MDDPRVILFDLDDTIIDFSWNSAESWRLTCLEVQEETGADPAALQQAINEVANHFWADHDRAEAGRRDLILASATIVAEAFATLEVPVRPQLPGEMSARYRKRREDGMRLFEGAIEVLETLRGQGRRLALITNGSQQEQRAKIERFNLESHFDHIQIEGEFGLGKPHDAAYRHALQTMNAEPATTWFVGDNLEWDVAAPQRHGIFGIWVDGRRRGVPPDSDHAPDRIVHRITELI